MTYNRSKKIYVVALGLRWAVGEESETEYEFLRFDAGFKAIICTPYKVLVD